MPTILLLRHGETHWNRAKRIQGHTDAVSPLTLKGVGQAQAYGEAIRRLVGDLADWRVVSSPLARCVQTTAILCEAAGLDFDRVAFDDRLKEVSTGDFSGRLKHELEASHPELMRGKGLNAWYLHCPGGESWDELSARLSSWLAERTPGEKVIAVTHGASGKALRALYGRLDPHQAMQGEAPQDAFFRLAEGRVEKLSVTE